MEYTKEHQLPTPYRTITQPRIGHSPKRQPWVLRHSRRFPRWLLWAAGALAVVGVLAALYFISTAAVKGTLLNVNSGGSLNGTAPAPTAADLGHSYGIAAGGSLNGLNDSDLDRRMAGISSTGAKWVRFDFKWSEIQPNGPNSYSWSSYDRLIRAAEKHHLFILGILDFTPPWARSGACADTDKCAPANPQQFATFAAAVASRYKTNGLRDWEIWNEPNNPQFWQPRADPAAYAKLLQATSKAMRAANPNVYLITAGLSPQATTGDSYAPVDFLTAVYKAGAKGSFDAVADHPYTFPLSPKDPAPHAWNQMAGNSDSLRQVMVGNGDGNKKIWITEFGSPTGGPGPVSTIQKPNLDQQPYVVDDGLQAKILGDAIGLYKSYSWVGPFFYYSYQDAGTSNDTNENFFGLVSANGTLKPAYQVFQGAAKAASGSK